MRLGRIILLGCFALVLAGCSKSGGGSVIDPETGQAKKVPVDFALSIGGGNAGTKANVSLLPELHEEAPTFHGISSVRVVPFAANNLSVSNDWMHILPQITTESAPYASTDGYTYIGGLVDGYNAHIYSGADAELPVGTTNVLVYGMAKSVAYQDVDLTEQELKHINGSIREEGLSPRTVINKDNVFFSPDPIYSGAAPAAAQTIVDALNVIAKGASITIEYSYKKNNVDIYRSVSFRWSEIGSDILREAYNTFVSNGEQTTGAGENVRNLIQDLYNTLKNYVSDNETVYMHIDGTGEYEAHLSNNDPLTYGFIYNTMCQALLDRLTSLAGDGASKPLNISSSGVISFKDSDVADYPVGLGLPAGAAVIQWTGTEFKVVTDGLDGITPMSKFCYMPPLYFYTESTISTTTDKNIYQLYKYSDQGSNNWSTLVGQYNSGHVITQRTASVAIDNALQYSCGMMLVTVQATKVDLDDNDGKASTLFKAEGKNFPITGIVVGGQHKLDYSFSPVVDSDEYFMYDDQISFMKDNPDVGVYLTTSQSSAIRTMVFPTIQDSDIYFFVEFRNDCGKSFMGAEGKIMPGSHFYLAGKLDKPSDADKTTYPSVFMSDHYTTANCTVGSLKDAHVCIPELGNPHMSLGVQTNIYWTQSAASHIILD